MNNKRYTAELRIRVEQLMKTNLRKLAKSNDTSESYEARQAIKDRIKRSGIKWDSRLTATYLKRSSAS